jgi:hypothetical protein
MATVSRGLPSQPHLDVPKREAKELLAAWRAGQPEAIERVRHRHPKFSSAGAGGSAANTAFKLADAQLVLAREYGFASWPELKRRIETNGPAIELLRAIRADDGAAAVAILRANPALLHVPLWSGNWGPPMSHAANLGRLAIVQAISALGARDHQHAFDRAILQGRIETARWLHAHGAKLLPGLVTGPCETLNVAGLELLLELGAPLVDEQGDRLAPLGLVLGTYARNARDKHAVLRLFATQGYAFPDTPIAAFHRGDLPRLREHLRRDPGLLTRRFSLREIYPAELGCTDEGRKGMHWTPIAGSTLLHLAVDFREHEILDWLLAARADANARAEIDAEGFGGHTALFNAVVCGVGSDAAMTRTLLGHGADRSIRCSLRKFLDWCDEPRWHEARDVTPAEWARTFPEKGWVNGAALRLLEA